MENTVISRLDQPKVPAVSATGAFVAVFFLAWLALIFVLGARGVFVAPRGAPPLALLIGLFSAIVDNVPLVAATMGMYSLQTFPMDDTLWHMIAYAAGTGGSILIIGSAAGVAFMGLEKVDFVSFVKTASFPALCGYLAGFGAYLLLQYIQRAA